MNACATIYRVEGDHGPDLYSELEGVDLTGKTISLTVRYELGGELSKAAVIDDAAAGEFHFVWDPTDLVEGDHRMEYVITDSAPVAVTRIPAESTLRLIVRAPA